MELIEMETREHGLCTYNVVKDSPLFGARDTFQSYENHKWRIREVQDPFETLAESEHAPAVIRHKEMPTYGLQFHPEHLTELSFGDELFLKLIKG